MQTATNTTSFPFGCNTRAELEARAEKLRASVRDCFTRDPAQARAYVMKCMHWNGELHAYVKPATWERAYLACDGFGMGWSREDAAAQCWDWSHVRDSSDGALVNAAVILACTDESLGLA